MNKQQEPMAIGGCALYALLAVVGLGASEVLRPVEMRVLGDTLVNYVLLGGYRWLSSVSISTVLDALPTAGAALVTAAPVLLLLGSMLGNAGEVTKHERTMAELLERGEHEERLYWFRDQAAAGRTFGAVCGLLLLVYVGCLLAADLYRSQVERLTGPPTPPHAREGSISTDWVMRWVDGSGPLAFPEVPTYTKE